MMNATYSPDDNKLRLYSAVRLDPDTYARVKEAGFAWAPKQDLFVAPMWTPDRADLLIDLCGEIGDEDTSLVDRAEDRAERFEDYSEKRAADSERATAAVKAIADGIPLGQPILVGHHSERHARKDAERIEHGMRRAVDLWKTSKYWTARAAGALRHAKYKELPTVRARRIKKLESERRGHVRAVERSQRFLEAWTTAIDAPTKDADGYFGAAPEPSIRRARAVYMANNDGGNYAPAHTHRSGYVGPISLWEAAGGNIHQETYDTAAVATVDQIRDKAIANHEGTIARAQRWIEHYDRRLEYERAMLDEQGGSALLQKKARPALLPLCNYRAPGGLSSPNPWHRGEMIHRPQVEMTQAEYAKIHTDYKGTAIVGWSHRIRTAMQRHSLVCVFLTDAKIHTPPDPVVRDGSRPAPDVRPEPERVRVAVAPATTPDHDAEIAAMRDSLTAGVSVVSAPQLFPTPTEVARRMVAAADIQPGHRVLEPSAGTGRLLEAIGVDRGGRPPVVAIEIVPSLAANLRQRFPLAAVKTADFLDCTPDAPQLGTMAIGRFDRIVMNPPFVRGSDERHIEHARRFLAPGGRLVALCADGPRQRECFDGATATSYTPLPEGSFASQGTNVRVALVVIDAPADEARADVDTDDTETAPL